MFHRILKKTRSWFNRVKNRFGKTLHIVEEKPDTDEIKRFLDDEERRHYTQNNEDVYSVTTVLDELEGEKWYLKKWKENNNGQGDNPYWKHILEYKQNRGTLAHYSALSRFRDGMWGGDESSSLDEVYDRNKDPAFLYSIFADKEWVSTTKQFETLQDQEDLKLEDAFYQDMDYFIEEFDKLCREKGIDATTVEEVEKKFVVPPNHEHDGYGGQVDLVYRDKMTGGLVVADLKTSKNVYDKHKRQIAAYSKAVEKTDDLAAANVERGEIIRIHPDTKETEVFEVSDFDEYWEEFAEGTKQI